MFPRRVARRAIDLWSLVHKAAWGFGRLTNQPGHLVKGRAEFYRSLWKEAAESCGGTARPLGGAVLEIRCRGVRVLVSDTLTSLDDPVTLRIAGNKPLVHELLGQRGIPVPRHVTCRFDDLDAAWCFASEHVGPVVVKPAWGTGAGEGITAAVSRRSDLAGAMARAGVYCADVVIEEQIEGDNYRLLYLDRELLDAVRRAAPSVRADGSSTIRQLIAAEIEDRRRGGMEVAQSLIDVDPEVRRALRAQGMDYDLSLLEVRSSG